MKFRKILAIVLLLVITLTITTGCGSEESRWSQLSDEEKDWYNRNYGNGKSEQYDKAIEDYKNSRR